MTEMPGAFSDRSARGPGFFGLGAVWFYALSGLGAVLYVLAGAHFTIDRVRCDTWPGAETSWLSAGLYMMALAAMGLGWLGLVYRTPGTTGRKAWLASLAAAFVVHAIILLVPPFLSDDALAYGAIGALPALHGADMYAPLGALPETDAYRQLIAQYPVWLAHPSTYAPGINALYALVIAIAGDNVRLALRLMQFAGLLALFATGLLAALAVRNRAALAREGGPADRKALMALNLVLFAPLGLIEATGNAHNDVFLALAIAGFAFYITRQRAGSGLVALALGFLVKLSAVLPFALVILRRAAGWLTSRPHPRLIGLMALAILAGIGFAWFAWPMVAETANTVVRLVAPPDGGAPFCTRSFECLPRWLFHYVFNWPEAAWITGLLFRAGGVAVLLVMAWRYRHAVNGLSALAGFMLFYYLFLHGYMQAWYLLALLPLAPFLSASLRAVALAYLISSLAQYGLDFAWSCTSEPPFAIVREIGGLVVVLAPPLIVLGIVRWKRRGLDSAG